MNVKTLSIIIGLITFCDLTAVYAQHTTAGIDVENPESVETTDVLFSISLDKKDWIYTLDERPVFTLKMLVGNTPANSADVFYTIGPEKMKSTQSGKVELKNGHAELVGPAMTEPGFLRCDVQVSIKGKTYRAVATAAFEPEKIMPTGTEPLDFDKFWADAIGNSKSIPLNTRLTPIPNKSNDSVKVYQAEYEFFNNGVQKFYGVLSMPTKEGKYPAIIRFPGAGWLPLGGDQKNAAAGFITLDLYIHGRPVTLDRSYYVDLQNNELKGYQYKGVADRDSFYYKNAILGCVRSVDLIYSLPQFDGEHIGGWGSSQGGALSIITSSLESRINYLVALCPAMCDFNGYLNNRAGGWPHLFAKPELYADKKDQVIRTLSYYDVVHFAKRLKAPSFLSWGFNDPVTPPTSIYAAYNAIEAPKKLFIIPSGVHKIYPDQRDKTYAWLKKKLKATEGGPVSEFFN